MVTKVSVCEPVYETAVPKGLDQLHKTNGGVVIIGVFHGN